nr:hypothetical protein [Tanacetum cinerariifolium]
MEHYPHLDNGFYNVVDRVMRPLTLKQTRKPQIDRGKSRHSVSSTFAHHNRRSSSHQEDDDEDDDASRASTPSPTTYLTSLGPLNYQQYDPHLSLPRKLEHTLEILKLVQIHSISKPFSSNKFPPNVHHHFIIFFILYQPPQTTTTSTRASIFKAFKRPKINIIPPKQLFMDLTHDDTKTPLPKHQLSSLIAPNAPLKTPSTKCTSLSSIDYTPKSPTSSTSPSTDGYLNSPTSPLPRVPPPPSTQENASMDITLTLSPITLLDV